VELVLQLGLRALGARSNGFGVVAVESAGGLGVVSDTVLAIAPTYSSLECSHSVWCDVQTRPILIITRNQQRNTKRPTHDALLALCTFTEPQRQIAYRLRAALDSEGLVVVEGMVLGLDARVLDHAACVGLQARHGASDVAVDFDNLFDGAGLEESRGYALFYAENYAFARCDLHLPSAFDHGR